MNGSSRRQWVLLVVLAAAVFAYFRYGDTSFSSSGGAIGDLPPIDAAGLVKALQGVSTVNPVLVPSAGEPSDPDRNLFQYGEKRPPPPPPMTEEQRKAAEEALRKQEEIARAQKEAEAEQQRQIAAAQAAAAQAAAQQQPPPEGQAEEQPQQPALPVKAPPPPINYRFVGVIGPASKKVGVFMDGDKLVLARKGEIVDGKFRVIDIGREWSVMGYTDPELKDTRKVLYFGQ